MRTSLKLVGAFAVAGLVATGGSAFTSANSVAASKAGFGTTAITTYSTSNVQYNANTTDPEQLDSVTFTLNATARYVALRTKATGTWVRSDDVRLPLATPTGPSCTSADATTWTCNVTGLGETVAAANSLSVVATS